MGNRQTIATSKYQAKIGLIAKTYKLDKTVVENFRQSCAENGRSQASVLNELMTMYTEGKLMTGTDDIREGRL